MLLKLHLTVSKKAYGLFTLADDNVLDMNVLLYAFETFKFVLGGTLSVTKFNKSLL